MNFCIVLFYNVMVEFLKVHGVLRVYSKYHDLVACIRDLYGFKAILFFELSIRNNG